jgi:hypothetical protein
MPTMLKWVAKNKMKMMRETICILGRNALFSFLTATWRTAETARLPRQRDLRRRQ